MRVRDYSAELHVAGRFADAGWNVYFPHRDRGFDFIVSKDVGKGQHVLRPVQVKGKYPLPSKGSTKTYGFIGKLSKTHPEMVLAIPFYSVEATELPTCIAYMPFVELKSHSRGVRCQPAAFKNGVPLVRHSFQGFYDNEGLRALEAEDWATTEADRYAWVKEKIYNNQQWRDSDV